MSIYLNQVGYPTNAPKEAISTTPCNFQVISTADQTSVLDGVAQEFGKDAASGDCVWHIDFTSVTTPGSYYILGAANEKSPVFTIGEHVYKSLKNDMIKALYFQRCGCGLLSKYAGVYSHNPCHTADAIMLEDYMNKAQNPKSYDMTGGWHDAGDFGRYTSAGAVAVAHMLYAFELFPENFKETINIPESGNDMPDLLNECLYELTWLLKMQAPNGGAYHKLTSFCHADFIMPEEDLSQFLIYPISSFSTADYAAVMALASRVYAPYRPDFAKQALEAARRAWDWLSKNPYVAFHNPEGSNTGEYDDRCDLDERLWASAELLRTDAANADAYALELKRLAVMDLTKTDFGWTDVSGFAIFPVLFDEKHSAGSEIEQIFIKALFKDADALIALTKKSGYRVAMSEKDFCWGSNMVVCNRSMLLVLASILADSKSTFYRKDTNAAFSCREYLEAARNQINYLLGTNALGISYVTGNGENAFRNPHNRPTFADGIDDPMPGWVSGGPFATPCDEAAIRLIPAGTAPMKCYVDHVDSYSTNEITIYWNSPAIFVAAFLDQNQHKQKQTGSTIYMIVDPFYLFIHLISID